MKKKFILLLISMVVVMLMPCMAAAHTAKPKILYLNSYENGYAWSDNILAGIRSAIQESGMVIDLQIEYMDTKKYYDPSIEQMLFDYYRYKFRNTRFDAVIVSDNNAFEFMLRHQYELIPDVPLIFCGINDFRTEMLAGRKNITGIVENIRVKEILEMALGLHPGTRKFIVIGDESATGRAIANQVKNALPQFYDRLEVEFWTGFKQPDFLQRVKRIAPDSILFLVPFYEDVHGNFYSARDVLNTIYEHTNVPIYSCWEFLLGYGIVGGKLTSGRLHGREAANLAIRILKGEDPAAIPVVTETDDANLFDYNLLTKFHLTQKQLPKGSRIINEPYQFYKLNRQVFWVIIISFIFLIVITVFLIINIIQRQAAEKKYRSIFENASKGIFISNLNGHYINVNQAFAKILGYDSEDEVLSQINYTERPHALSKQYEEFWNLMRKGETVSEFEMGYIRKDGNISWVSLNAQPVYDKKRKIQHIEAFAEDITKRVNLEKQLLQSQKMEALGILSGGIAHDFNNILTSIINSTELAIEDVPEDSVTRSDLERVLKAANRGSQLVQQILTFSRPTQEGFQPIDINAVVSDALGLIKASLPGNIKVVEHVRQGPGLCIADPIQIHQIVMNLCTNSIQALGDKGGKLEIGLEKAEVDAAQAEMLNVKPGRYWKLTITDNGPGISPDIMDKIFDPFFTTKKKGEGTGLGLAVVHGIVKGHKGGIEVTSRPYEQISFEIYLPCNPDVGVFDEDSAEELQRGRERILFVEDDDDQRETIPRVLAQLGYEVTAARDADEALHQFSESPLPFNLVITDFDMPETNGFELAARIEKLSPNTPVIIVSGRQRAASIETTGNIKKIVSKPYNKAVISEAIRQILDTEDCKE